MRMRRRAILALVYSKRDLLRGRVWEPTSRNIQESRDSMRISILSGSFRLAREVLLPKGVLEFITARSLSRYFVCFVLELSWRPFQFYAIFFQLKVHLVRIPSRLTATIGRKGQRNDFLDWRKKARSKASFGSRIRFVSSKHSPENGQFDKLQKFARVDDSTDIFCRDKQKIISDITLYYIYDQRGYFLSITFLEWTYYWRRWYFRLINMIGKILLKSWRLWLNKYSDKSISQTISCRTF